VVDGLTASKTEVVPGNEAARMAAVHRYDVLDTPADGAFDRITRIASEILETPIALITIVDHDRIWFKSSFGLEGVEQIDRDPGLCASAILHEDAWVVRDAISDPRTLESPLVAGELGLRFYAGCPLRTSDGYNLGTLCVIDREAREPTAKQLELLADLAALVVDELELRLSARRVARQATELNDDVVQALATGKLAADIGDSSKALASIDLALEASKRILSELAADSSDLRRG
jgi:GAF domain-containing protein